MILAFDEVQTLSVGVLEQIRLFSTLETSRRRMVEIVLAGQLSFAERLNLPELQPLRQRIGLLAHLQPLRPDGVHEYIRHRLKIAECERALFTPRAVAEIARLARGIPRTINHLCHNAMALAWAQGESKVRNEFVLQAAQELEARPVVAEEVDGPDLASQKGLEIAALPPELSAGQFEAAARAPRGFSGPRYPNEQLWTPRQLIAAGETPSAVPASANQPLHELGNGAGSAQEFVEGDDTAVSYEAEPPRRPAWMAEAQPAEALPPPVSKAAPDWDELSERSESAPEENEHRAEPAVSAPPERPFQGEPPAPEPTAEGVPMPGVVKDPAPQQEARRDGSLFLTLPKGML